MRIIVIFFLLISFVSGAYAKSGGNAGSTIPIQSNSSIDSAVTQAQMDINHIENQDSAITQQLNNQTATLMQLQTYGSSNSLNEPLITYQDSSGNNAIMKFACSDNYKNCYFIKQTATLNASISPPKAPPLPVAANTPSTSGTKNIVHAIAGIIYILLTVYLFIIASSNLFKREILYFMIDIFMWAGLTAVLYVVWNAYL